ncbi:MAG: 50S ribosomal protein L23 [Candidatus Marinimicrobia bacterium]|nr:50S ribosomal protein L23 [Candidatus Neomarinimicrobiota bacterium]|tara:strand:- start:2357 stop:2671 length:315 start_codon:yes stop_codon:yes gene_type:complete
MNLEQIIIEPMLTEKGAVLQENFNKFLFKVSSSSNKIQVKKAIELKFGVKVGKVAIINVKGKTKSMSVKSSGRTIRTQGKKSSWKKAVVTLKEGSSIDLTNMEF